jgi:hypothetical protein
MKRLLMNASIIAAFSVFGPMVAAADPEPASTKADAIKVVTIDPDTGEEIDISGEVTITVTETVTVTGSRLPSRNRHMDFDDLGTFLTMEGDELSIDQLLSGDNNYSRRFLLAFSNNFADHYLTLSETENRRRRLELSPSATNTILFSFGRSDGAAYALIFTGQTQARRPRSIAGVTARDPLRFDHI